MNPRQRLDTLFAIIRIDSEVEREEDRVTVKEVVSSEAEAISEVDRLNAIRPDETVRYFWQATRLIEP
jgi:hypothetical protein